MSVVVPLGGLSGSFFGGWISDRQGKVNFFEKIPDLSEFLWDILGDYGFYVRRG
jgi:hypothetical protein